MKMMLCVSTRRSRSKLPARSGRVRRQSPNRLTSEAHALGTGGSPTLTYSQTYDANSRIITFTTADGSSAFTYDNNNQLRAATAGSVPAEDLMATGAQKGRGGNSPTGA